MLGFVSFNSLFDGAAIHSARPPHGMRPADTVATCMPRGKSQNVVARPRSPPGVGPKSAVKPLKPVDQTKRTVLSGVMRQEVNR